MSRTDGKNACIAKVEINLAGATFNIQSQRDGIHVSRKYSREDEKVIPHAKLVQQAFSTFPDKRLAIEVHLIREDLGFVVAQIEAGVRVSEDEKAEMLKQVKRAEKAIKAL